MRPVGDSTHNVQRSRVIEVRFCVAIPDKLTINRFAAGEYYLLAGGCKVPLLCFGFAWHCLSLLVKRAGLLAVVI